MHYLIISDRIIAEKDFYVQCRILFVYDKALHIAFSHNKPLFLYETLENNCLRLHYAQPNFFESSKTPATTESGLTKLIH